MKSNLIKKSENKKIHRFYLPEFQHEIELGKEIIIQKKALLNQLFNVFRFNVGDKFIIFTGDGFDYLVEIFLVNHKASLIKIISKKENIKRSGIKINLIFALLKKENTEFVLQKCTEIGVDKFTPIITDRTIKIGFNYDRNNKILIEAIEQSGFGTLPEINKEIIKLDKLIDYIKNENLSNYSYIRGQNNIFVLDLNGKKLSEYRLDIENIIKSGLFINIIIGPEGGFSEREKELFKKHNLQIITLGENILRGETACITITSILKHLH